MSEIGGVVVWLGDIFPLLEGSEDNMKSKEKLYFLPENLHIYLNTWISSLPECLFYTNNCLS